LRFCAGACRPVMLMASRAGIRRVFKIRVPLLMA
jgi:hypothetical protein